jgi:hypothetical protein
VDAWDTQGLGFLDEIGADLGVFSLQGARRAVYPPSPISDADGVQLVL